MLRYNNNLDSILSSLASGKLQRETVMDSVFNKYRLSDISRSQNTQYIRLWNDDKIIAAIDVTSKNDITKINFISAGSVEDFNNGYKEDDRIFEALLSYADTKCKENNCSKMVIDLHGNLGRYKAQFEPKGFVLNGTKCSDNPFWTEAEKKC